MKERFFILRLVVTKKIHFILPVGCRGQWETCVQYIRLKQRKLPNAIHDYQIIASSYFRKSQCYGMP
jgi:hypothetical protein